MELQIRQKLYELAGMGGVPVFYNPVSEGDVVTSDSVVDLTYDIMGHTRLYHENTSLTREFVSRCGLVITDSPQLARLAKIFNSSAVPLPFGYSLARDTQGDFTVGILNHNEDAVIHNTWGKKIIKGVASHYRTIFYGDPMFDCESTVDFENFAGDCDVLLLPAQPRMLVSMTLPLSVMAASCVVITCGGFSALSASSGVMVMPDGSPLAWRRMVETFSQNPRKVQSLKERNLAYLRSVNKSTLEVLGNIAHRMRQRLAA